MELSQCKKFHFSISGVGGDGKPQMSNKNCLHPSVSLACETFTAYDFLKISNRKLLKLIALWQWGLHHINISPREVKTERISNPQFHAIKILVSWHEASV